jgi:hypothetical protein
MRNFAESVEEMCNSCNESSGEGNCLLYPASDWENALYAKSPVTVSNQISMSGGNDKSNFYLNLEYQTKWCVNKHGV